MNHTLQQTADQIMAQDSPKAKIVGVVFETYAQYIKQKQGPEGLKKLQDTMASLGYPFNLKTIKSGQFQALWLPL